MNIDQNNDNDNIIQFTTKVWELTAFQNKFNMLHKEEIRDAPVAKWLKQVKVISENEFPFLDMKMSWTEDGQLRFNVFNKKKQAIKYVEKGSTHRTCTFKSITLGVYTRLGRLTSKTPENANLQINKLYPLHLEALLTANLELVEFPTMGKFWKKEKETKEKLSSK
eukprot:4033961-Ditylum_brightwellii.AAC.1